MELQEDILDELFIGFDTNFATIHTGSFEYLGNEFIFLYNEEKGPK